MILTTINSSKHNYTIIRSKIKRITLKRRNIPLYSKNFVSSQQNIHKTYHHILTYEDKGSR